MSRGPPIPISFDQLLRQTNEQMGQGRLADAEAACRAAFDADPQHGGVCALLGLIAFRAQRIGDAEAAWRKALTLRFDDANVAANFSALLGSLGRMEESIAFARQAIALQPDGAAGYLNLGAALAAVDRPDDALAAFQQALRYAPRHADALANAGVLAAQLNRLDMAAEYCRRAIEIAPGHADATSTLDHVLKRQRALDESIDKSQRAVELSPDDAQAWRDLGYSLLLLGDAPAAVTALRRALAIKPRFSEAHSMLLLSLHFDPSVSPEQMWREHQRFGQLYNPLAFTLMRPKSPQYAAGVRRIRVAYLSPYFTFHAVNYFVEPILRSHDRKAFEITCYSDVREPDDVTAHLRGLVDHWEQTASASDEELYERIVADGQDILVDLSGHLPQNRLPALAKRAAPVQITYIGYQTTTGLAAMDYRITDAVADPPGQTEQFHSEQLLRLPCFFVYQPPRPAPPVAAQPPVLDRGHITFASLNQPAKVSDAAVELWSRVLTRVTGSRLILLVNSRGESEARLHRLFARHGIDPARITFAPRGSHLDYLESYGGIDVALDPFSMSGHTTTCDALWMGVPVVTLAGNAYASRMTASTLTHLGMPQWIAQTPKQYVDIVAGLASDPGHLTRLRATLRPMMAASVITAAKGFTAHLESAYRLVWDRWCSRERG